MSMVNVNRILEMNVQRNNETRIAFDSGNLKTAEITRQNPIMYMLFRLAGGITPATANAVLTSYAGMNLIRSITFKINNRDVVVSLPGFVLQRISELYTRSAPYKSDPAVTYGATRTFEYAWRIPFDSGGYFSPLDASRENSLQCIVQWGTLADLAAAGGGGTLTLDTANTFLDIDTMGVSGGAPGQPGGPDTPYPRHQLLYREETITAAETSRTIALNKQHIYNRVVMFTHSDGVPVDTILNSVRVQVGNSILQNVTGRFLQLQGCDRYARTPYTGMYVLDFAEPGRLEQMLVLSGTQNFNLLLNVSHPGTTDKIFMVEDTFIKAQS